MKTVYAHVEVVQQQSGWDLLDISTVLIAGFALAVSIVSAGFNIWSWHRQGPRPHTSIQKLHDKALWLSVSNIGRMPAKVEPIIVSDEKAFDWCRLPIPDFSFSDDGHQKIMNPGDYIAGAVPLKEFAIVMHDNKRKLKDVRVVIRFAGRDLRIKIPRKIRRQIFGNIRNEIWDVCEHRQKQRRPHHPPCKQY
ncbi:hypothetical protein [Corynebacterium ammoniagenes]|uniref:hypothetical protein n=1 Tax=Corynebacterium ammoniagenes TaxID=1697 RepID=UPI001F21BCA4|nr:hypothetical protein [Corynebacterium ammoniagenes]